MTDPSLSDRGFSLSAAIQHCSDPEIWEAYTANRRKKSRGGTVVKGIKANEPLEHYLRRRSRGIRSFKRDGDQEIRIWRKLLRAFVTKLRHGELIAYGYPLPRSLSIANRVPVPLDLWHEEPKIDWRKSTVAGNGLEFVSVRVFKSQSDKQAESDPEKGGTLGRPPKFGPKIEAIFERRRDASELEDSLAEEARSILAEYKRLHPYEDSPTVGYIRNLIRKEYRKIVPG